MFCIGFVSPIKNQYDCGSCVAFASMAAVETCFRKLTGVFGDYAEQEFVDCAYGQNGANGCNGAPPSAYLQWATAKQFQFAHESQYPYLNLAPKLSCPATMPIYHQGAKVNTSYYTYSSNEALLQQLVYTYGAVVSTVKASGPFELYSGGIFAGCNPGNDTDHAIAVVGWGTAGGVDYWLIKNSWGPSWGESGFIRLKRGVGMCGIGQTASVVSCVPVPGATDAPLTTAKPCVDAYSNCADLAVNYCYQPSIASSCYKSCGLCPGMTPAKSNTCFDTYSNCATLCGTSYKSVCKKSCGGC
jgi:Papain family cysteine protease/ShK domain-like